MDAKEMFERSKDHIAKIYERRETLTKLEDQRLRVMNAIHTIDKHPEGKTVFASDREALFQAIVRLDAAIAATKDNIDTRTEIIALYTQSMRKLAGL